jgi:hypothetical protein
MMATKTTPLPIPLVLIMPLVAGNNHNAVGGTCNAINDCNNHNAVCGRDDDIMSLSYTNQSLQPHISASDSSSYIGPHPYLECNACSKVNRYDIKEDSSMDQFQQKCIKSCWEQ